MDQTIFCATDIGKKRANNEDKYAHFECGGFFVLVVCDGMGGHQGGEVASTDAVKEIEESFRRNDRLPAPDRIRQAITDANTAVFRKAQARAELRGMGTTCVALVVDMADGSALIAHVGDSRCYRLTANGSVEQTKDHSHVQQLIDMGELTKKQAANHEFRNVITRAIGTDASVETDINGPYKIADGDRFLLCSDGLTDMVEEKDIVKTLWKCRRPQQAVERLIAQANENGGIDNITVCIAAYGKRKPKYPHEFIKANTDTQVERTVMQRTWRVARWVLLALLLIVATCGIICLCKPSYRQRVKKFSTKVFEKLGKKSASTPPVKEQQPTSNVVETGKQTTENNGTNAPTGEKQPQKE